MTQFLCLFIFYFVPLAALADQNNSSVEIKVVNDFFSPMPGITVAVDGKIIGKTNSHRGNIFVPLKIGKHQIEAFVIGFRRGSKWINVNAANQKMQIQLQLDQPDVELKVANLVADQIITSSLNTLDISAIAADGKVLTIEDADWLYFEDLASKQRIDVKEFFVVENGRLVCREDSYQALRRLLQEFRNTLAFVGRLELADYSKRNVEVRKLMAVGRYTVTGRIRSKTYNLRGLANEQSLEVYYRPVNFTEGFPTKLTIQTDVKGNFSITDVPYGYLEIQAKPLQQGKQIYYQDWLVEVFGDVAIELNPLALQDYIKRVSEIRYRKRSLDARFAPFDIFDEYNP